MDNKWGKSTLGLICGQITKGSTPTTNGFEFTDTGVNFVKVENIRNGQIDAKSIRHFISNEAHEYQSRSQLEVNDLLFSIAGTIGTTCLVKEVDLPANTNQALAILRGYQQSVTPKFLSLQLDSFVAHATKGKARGGAMNNISLGDLKSLEVILPPIGEQEQIVAKIEELFSELDASVESLNKAKAQLRIYRQSVLKHAFEGRLTNDNITDGELPSGWTWEKLEQTAVKITDGEHVTPRRTEDGILLLSARNVQNGYLDLTKVDYIPEDEFERITKRCKPEGGDILISCSGSVGRVCMVPANLRFTLVRSVALVKLDRSRFLPKFFEYLLQSPILQKQIEKGKKATAQANLFLGPIKNLDVISCSLDEQEAIVSEIESRLSVCDKLEESIEAGLKQSEALRQSILKKAFEGKLV